MCKYINKKMNDLIDQKQEVIFKLIKDISKNVEDISDRILYIEQLIAKVSYKILKEK